MKIGVIMGGISTEREISLKTGQNMFDHLDREKYEVEKIVLDTKSDIYEKAKDIDFALIALHGKFGEDGTIQSILSSMDIPFSGCDAKSSAISMDKDYTKNILKANNITTADWIIARGKDDIDACHEFFRKYNKVVVKPNSGGSSVMTFVVKSEDELEKCIMDALTVDNEVMVEQYLKGDEITVPVVDGKTWPTLIIKANDGFFDYVAKYQDKEHGGATEEVVELEKNLQEEVNKLALDTFKVLKCSVYGRVDMLVVDGKPYVLEINTLPGMTNASLIPKSAKSIGIEYKELLNLIINLSLKQRKSEGLVK